MCVGGSAVVRQIRQTPAWKLEDGRVGMGTCICIFVLYILFLHDQAKFKLTL